MTGQVASGIVRVGDPLTIERPAGSTIATSCAGVEMFRKKLDHAAKGDNVGLMLQGVEREQVSQGDWLRARSW
jgi:elongation factor Tu